MKTKKAIFWAIVILACILRFHKLGTVPPSLNWDEAGMGYNAYSLIKTGGFDEYGELLPLSFRSFDDYKPPLYTYMTTIPILVLGYNDVAIRITSAVAGVLTVVFTYLLARKLFKSEKIALLAMFFLTVSPWHLQFSRVAFEANVALLFLVAGTWAFLNAVQGSGQWFLLSVILFGLSLYAYHSSRLFVPLFSMILLVLYKKEIIKKLRWVLLAGLLVSFFILPLIPILASVSGQMRFKGTSIFYRPDPLEKSIIRIEEDRQINQELIGKIFHNRKLAYLRVITKNYLSHFRPEFLFFEADTATHHAPGIGLLYLWDLPFILIGVYCLFKKNFGKPTLIVTTWFLLGPLASSFTWETPNAIRSELMLPTYQIFMALGVFHLFEISDKKKSVVKLLYPIILFLFVINFSYYLHQYYAHLNRDYSRDWSYGRKEAAEFTSKLEEKYEKIIVSTNLDKAYMHFLYYLKYDPNKYLKEGGTVSGGFLEQKNKFGKYEFRQFDFNKERKENFLFIGENNEFPADAHILKTINYLDNKGSIKIVDG